MGVCARPETDGEGLVPPRSELMVPGGRTLVLLSITPPVVEESTAEDEGATTDVDVLPSDTFLALRAYYRCPSIRRGFIGRHLRVGTGKLEFLPNFRNRWR